MNKYIFEEIRIIILNFRFMRVTIYDDTEDMLFRQHLDLDKML